MIKNQKCAFTLTEILIAMAIVGIIAIMILPSLINSFQDDLFERAHARKKQSLINTIDQLEITENKDFFETMMYEPTDKKNYIFSSGAFLIKYMRVSKACGDSNGKCFAPIYYNSNSGISRSIYKPNYKGSCASLKDGSSICILPQIANEPIKFLIDINGAKGPNIYGKDLREDTLPLREKPKTNKTTEPVYF